jgi:hypothetical protein
MSKNEHVKILGLLQPLDDLDETWKNVSMDFISGLSNFEGKTIITVVMDRFTK